MTRRDDGSLGRRYWDLCVLYLVVAAQAALALRIGGRDWFSGDLLHFYVARGGLPNGAESLMEPHTGQWQLTLILIYVLLFKLIGLTTYVPVVALAVLVHVALVLVMHRLLLRWGSGRASALVAALVLAYGVGSAARAVEAPLALTLPLLLGAISLLVLGRRGHDARSTVVAGALLLVGVTVSLVGVVAGVWVGVVAQSKGGRHALRVVALPAVALLAWGAWWGWRASGIVAPGTDVAQVAEVAARLMVAPFDDRTGGWLGVPVVVLVVVLAALYRGLERPLLVHATTAGVVAAVLHAVLMALTTVPGGVDPAMLARWRCVALVLLVPGLALVLDALGALAVAHLGGRQRRSATVLAGVALGLLALLAGLGQHQWALDAPGAGAVARTHLAGTMLATSTGEEMLTDAVPGSTIRGDDLRRLSDPALGSELPVLLPSEQDRIEAESNYFVAVTDAQLELATPTDVFSNGFVPEVEGRPGCHTHAVTSDRPTVVLTSFIGAGFRFRGGAGAVSTRLSRPDEDRRTDPIEWPASPDEWTSVATTAQLAELAVTFAGSGDYEFCFAD